MSIPATPLSVDWPRIGRGPFERLVSIALNREHNGVKRIDGSGGDRGRDLHFPGPEGLEVYQLKYFSGRLTASRRAQVKSSFDRAMADHPRKWSLVVPIIPTLGEYEWFEKLTKDCDAECELIGETELDAMMIRHPGVPRYVLGDVDAAIRKAAQDFQAEKAALTSGWPDAIARIRAIIDLLNDLSPTHRVDFVLDSATGSTQAQLKELYPGADADAGLGLHMTLEIPDDAEGQELIGAIEAHMDFGTPTTVPGKYLKNFRVDLPFGLGAAGTPEALMMRSAPVEPSALQRIVLKVTTPHGVPLAALQVEQTDLTRGMKGAVVTLSDGSGAISAVLTIDQSTNTIHYNQSMARWDLLPRELVPVMHFLNAAHTPNLLSVVDADGAVILEPTELPNAKPEGGDGWERAFAALARVQQLTGVFFLAPTEFTNEDQEQIDTADRLLRGEVVERTWTQSIIPKRTVAQVQTLLQSSEAGGGQLVPAQTRTLTVTISGQAIPLGEALTVVRSARIKDAEDLARRAEGAAESELFDVVLVPGSTDVVEQRLRPPDSVGTVR